MWRAVMSLFCSAWRHLAAQWNWRPDSWRNSHLPPHIVALVFIGISYSALRLQTVAALGAVTVNLWGNHSLIRNVFYIQNLWREKKTPQHRLTLRIFSHQIEALHISVVHFPEATVHVDGQMWLIHLWILLLVLQLVWDCCCSADSVLVPLLKELNCQTSLFTVIYLITI